MGHRLVLSDLSPQMIAHAREKAGRLRLDQQIIAYHVLDICDMHTLPEAHFDLILALGGPLSLCSRPQVAVRELHRLAKPGAYVLADAANRYRTALDLVQDGQLAQLTTLLEEGTLKRSDGLTDHRFASLELGALFSDGDLRPEPLVAVCPLLPYLPTEEQVRLLDDPHAYDMLRDVSTR
jgi:SAM-dependent methyltransferase